MPDTKIVTYTPTGPPVAGQGIAGRIPPSVLTNNFSLSVDADQQYCWIQEEGVLVFTYNGRVEPPATEKAYMFDEYGRQLVDPSLDFLYAANFEGYVKNYLVANGGTDQLVDSFGAELFYIPWEV